MLTQPSHAILPIKLFSILPSFLSPQCKLWKWFGTRDRKLPLSDSSYLARELQMELSFSSNWSTPALFISLGYRFCFQISEVLSFLNRCHVSHFQQTCTCKAFNKMEGLFKWWYVIFWFQSVSFHGLVAERKWKEKNLHLLLNILTSYVS